jgi:hypothetical protein
VWSASRISAGLALFLFLAGGVAVAAPSEAEKAAARKLVAVGDDHLAHGRYADALEAYRGADEIMKVPTTGIEVARTLVLLGRLLEAQQVLARITSAPGDGEPSAFARARETATALAADLEVRVPTLEVAIEPDVEGAVITVDGRPIEALTHDRGPLRLDPGPHQIVATAPGHRRVSREVTLVERRPARVVLLLEPEAAPAPTPRADTPAPATDEGVDLLPLSIAGFGLAAAGAIAGAVTGALSLGKVGEAEDLCGGRTGCSSDARALVDDAATLAHVSTASFAVAGLGAALGVIFLAVELGGDDAEVAWRVGPTTTEFRWRF